MGLHSISTFINGFNGGTRPNRFRISGTGGGSNLFGANANDSILVMAAQLPESTIGVIPIPFRGRVYKFPGDRDYLPWQFTVLDDVGGENNLYKKWHAWSAKFNDHANNVSTSRKQKTNFSQDFVVTQLNHGDDTPIRSFKLHDVWPIQIGPLELNMATSNQPATFTCQVAYSYYDALFADPAIT